MSRFFKTRSFRFWIALGMILALAPLAVSAIGGYILLNHGVVASFQDVADRQRTQVVPAQRLRLLIWDTVAPVDEFVEAGDGTRALEYRALRGQIESAFAGLDEAMKGEPAARTLLERARDDWTAADHSATELVSVSMAPEDPRTIEMTERFHGQVAASSDRLAAIYDQLGGDIEHDHDAALLFYERSLWLTGIAGAVSLLTIIAGVILIGRVLAGSVDRLVNGAARFAEGDRDHRIDVQVPPELHRVAEEFNHMIRRIHDSEGILADLAHRDALTRLPNRRAFDEGLAEVFARFERYGELATLLALDVDHFKRINDTYGHAAGDEVLRALADVMSTNLRPFDRAFRTGGEEFSILLPATDVKTGRETAERLRAAIESRPVRYKDTEIAVTVSLGAATAAHGIDKTTLTEAADAALYQAKLRGRNRVVVSGEDDRRERNAA